MEVSCLWQCCFFFWVLNCTECTSEWRSSLQVWPHRSNFPLLGKFLISAAVIGWVLNVFWNLIGWVWKHSIVSWSGVSFGIWFGCFLIEFFDFCNFNMFVMWKVFLTQGLYTNAHESWKIRDCYKTLGPICRQIKNFRTTIKMS